MFAKSHLVNSSYFSTQKTTQSPLKKYTRYSQVHYYNDLSNKIKKEYIIFK